MQGCGLRSQMTGRVGENNGAKREKLSEFWEFLETSKSARIRMNPRKHARVGTKKTNRMKDWFLGGDYPKSIISYYI
ncbi:hypothetical protein SAMN05421882_1001161 [Nitrosomonas communis]|uniref:Uncharacterized protein n=1 Tax=Nitrosomonas communis TaxID=44574 RepID=A0A1H2Q086_9PROT|nr:hypothetical protein SAMN05421882_1001161 [Nitrosomonas communis]